METKQYQIRLNGSDYKKFRSILEKEHSKDYFLDYNEFNDLYTIYTTIEINELRKLINTIPGTKLYV